MTIVHRGSRDIRCIFVYIQFRAKKLPRNSLKVRKGDHMASKKSASKKSSKKSSKKAPSKKSSSKKGGSKKAPSKKGGGYRASTKGGAKKKPAPSKKAPSKKPSKKGGGGSKKGGSKKSYISRAVKTIKSTASTIGSAVSGIIPGGYGYEGGGDPKGSPKA